MTLQTDFACIGDLTAYLLELAKPEVKTAPVRNADRVKPGESVFVEDAETNRFGFRSPKATLRAKAAPAGGELDEYDFGQLDAAKLTNISLAAIVKEEKAKGKTLKEIGEFSGFGIDNIKKYSAALSKAEEGRKKAVHFGAAL